MWNSPNVSKCSDSASGSALGLSVAKVLIISSLETVRHWLSVCGAPTVGAHGGKHGLLTQMECCTHATLIAGPNRQTYNTFWSVSAAFEEF
jgi:hypothetical protein